ncbi:MAG: lipopolysaccharide biosynthesis protein [Gemmatimonadota bacterium]
MTPGLRSRFSAWVRSPSVRVAALFAFAGVGFAGGNLLLARALTRAEFGLVALWLAVFYLGGALGPWGADGVVNRRRILPGWRLIRRVLFTSAVTASLAILVANLLYPFEPLQLALLGIGIVVFGMGTVAAAQFQAWHRFLTAMSIWQGSNFVLLFAAIVTLLWSGLGVLLPIVVFTGGAALVSAAGWFGLRRVHEDEDATGEPYQWSEALSYYLAASATAFLPQIERLFIPRVLSLEDLAVFGVLAALVISPYRMLQSGVGYTLFPRLSAASSRRSYRRLLREELRTMAVVGGTAGIAVWYLAPWVTALFLGDKYELGPDLILAGLVAGIAKLVGAIGRALVSALGSNRDLALYGAASWAALAAAGVGAVYGARWGVPGVIYGTTAGLLIRTLLALVLGLRHVTGPEREPTDAPPGDWPRTVRSTEKHA